MMHTTSRLRCAAGLSAVAIVFLACAPAAALIERLYSLEEILNESKVILEGRVAAVSMEKKAAIIMVSGVLRGQTPFRRINMNIAVGQEWYPDVMMLRLKVGNPALIFYDQADNQYRCLVHTDGIWFQLYGDLTDQPDEMWWRFTHIELKLKRTYDDTTPSLIELVKQILAGKAKPPPPQEKNGFWTREELIQEAFEKPKPAARTPGIVKAPDKPLGRCIKLPGVSGAVSAVAWVDYDNDGDFDVFVSAAGGMKLYRNEARQFIDATSAVGLKGAAKAAAWADYNLDGRPDLLVVTPEGKAVLYTHAGTRFVETPSAMTSAAAFSADYCAWVDADGNGRPDILLTSAAGGMLLLNQGRGPAPFAPAGAEWSVGGGRPHVLDFDSDGLADVLLTGARTALLRNDDGKALRPATQVDVATGDQSATAALGDFDGDGLLDVFIPHKESPRLYRNQGEGRFVAITDRSPQLAALREAVAAAWADVNGDAHLDLVVSRDKATPAVFYGDGKGYFADKTDAAADPTAIEAAASATVMVFGDFDSNGRPDLLFGTADGTAGIIVNTAPPSRPLRVPLRVRLNNACAPGALVRLHDNKDRLIAFRQIGLLHGGNSQEAPEALFFVQPGQYSVSVLLTDADVRTSSMMVSELGRIWFVPPPKKQ